MNDPPTVLSERNRVKNGSHTVPPPLQDSPGQLDEAAQNFEWISASERARLVMSVAIPGFVRPPNASFKIVWSLRAFVVAPL